MGHWRIQMMAQMQKHAAVACVHLSQNNHATKVDFTHQNCSFNSGVTRSQRRWHHKGTQVTRQFEKNFVGFVGKWEKWSYNCGKCGCLKISFAI